MASALGIFFMPVGYVNRNTMQEEGIERSPWKLYQRSEVRIWDNGILYGGGIGLLASLRFAQGVNPILRSIGMFTIGATGGLVSMLVPDHFTKESEIEAVRNLKKKTARCFEVADPRA